MYRPHGYGTGEDRRGQEDAIMCLDLLEDDLKVLSERGSGGLENIEFWDIVGLSCRETRVV